MRIGLITDNGWVRVVLPSSLSRYVYSLVEFERRVPILNPKLALETIYLAVKKEEEEEEKVREIMEVMRDPIVLGEIFSNTIPGRFEEKAVLKEELYRLLFEVLETFSSLLPLEDEEMTASALADVIRITDSAKRMSGYIAAASGVNVEVMEITEAPAMFSGVKPVLVEIYVPKSKREFEVPEEVAETVWIRKEGYRAGGDFVRRLAIAGLYYGLDPAKLFMIRTSLK